MEKMTLINISLEDDSLLSSVKVSGNENPASLENVVPYSPIVAASGKNIALANELQSSNSGDPSQSQGNEVCSIAGAHVMGKAMKSKAALVNVQNDLGALATNTQKIARRDSPLNKEKSDVLSPLKTQSQVNHDGHGRLHERMQEETTDNSSAMGSQAPPVKKLRSIRAHSLRKSLAWDKAFSTDEGVLDIDELPFATKVPKKLPDYPANIPMMPGIASPPLLDTTNSIHHYKSVREVEKSASNPVQSSIQSDYGENDGTCSLTSPSKGTLPEILISDPIPKVSKGEITRPVLAQKVSSNSRSVPVDQMVKADVLKGSRLRLPSRFTGKTEKAKELPKPQDMLRRCKSASSVLAPSSSSLLSKKVSSMSKKVKDTLGKVLPGSFGGSAKHREVNREGAHVTDFSGKGVNPSPIARLNSGRGLVSGTSLEVTANSTKTALQVEMNNGDASIADSSGKGMVVLKGSTKLKDLGLLGSPTVKAGQSPTTKGNGKPTYTNTKRSTFFSSKKPPPPFSQGPPLEKLNTGQSIQKNAMSSSGLRLPSPKMGFFDTPKTCFGDQTSRMSQRAASDRETRLKSRSGLPPLPPKELTFTRTVRVANDHNLNQGAQCLAKSGIPSAPHLRSSADPEKDRSHAVCARYGYDNCHGLPVVSGGDVPSDMDLDPDPCNTSEAEFHGFLTETSGTAEQFIPGCNGGAQVHPKVLEERLGVSQSDMPVVETINPLSPVSLVGKQRSPLPSDMDLDSTYCNPSETEITSHLAPVSLVVKQHFLVPSDMDLDQAHCNPSEVGIQDFHMETCGTYEQVAPASDGVGQDQYPRVVEESVGVSQSHMAVVETTSHLSPAPLLVKQNYPLITSASRRNSGKEPSSEESLQARKYEDFVNSTSPIADPIEQPGKQPLSMNSGVLNSIMSPPPTKKERNSSIVARSPSHCTIAQENSLVCEAQVGGTNSLKCKQRKSISSQKLDPMEANGLKAVPELQLPEDRLHILEEILQMKCGAVQHSPPNKKHTITNPWSPVKRNGQQLGPFDCTKKNVNLSSAQ